MKINIRHKFLFGKERGQSLVEVALFFPIFLIILAGLIEASNLVITSNKVHNAARVGARFGSNGGQDEGMSLSALNAVTDTLVLDENVWDMWAIRGTVNAAGDGFDDWEFNHVYGLQQTRQFSDVVESDVQQEVLEQLQTDQNGDMPAGIAGGLQFVGLYLIHDIDSILGLNAMPGLAEINSVKSLSVMRDLGLEIVTNDGCTAFPIAVRDDIRSVLPPGASSTAENRWPDTFAY
jgi:hypothetical protein